VADTGAYADEGVADAWARIEAGLSRVLPASLRQLAAPAEVQAIDAVEAALAVVLPEDFRGSFRIHNATTWEWGRPSPVPLHFLYDTNQIVEATRTGDRPDPVFDDPRVWAYLVDSDMLWLNGSVRPTLGSAGKIWVGTMNGDVDWFLDLDPPPGARADRWLGLIPNMPYGTSWSRRGRSCLSATPRIWNCSQLIRTARLW
jgi:hypothetical protein